MKRLYNESLPALNAKMVMLHNEGYKCITTKDIFNYLDLKWSKDTQICDMVDDIINADGFIISRNIKENLYKI